VHCNTAEGMWTDVRNFLRPFKGVHKKHLAGYVAICEFRRNLKRVSPAFISSLVTFHTFLHLSEHPLLIYYRVVLPAR
jgi:transposase-like protein